MHGDRYRNIAIRISKTETDFGAAGAGFVVGKDYPNPTRYVWFRRKASLDNYYWSDTGDVNYAMAYTLEFAEPFSLAFSIHHSPNQEQFYTHHGATYEQALRLLAQVLLEYKWESADLTDEEMQRLKDLNS